jgi:DNA-binding transcriptional MerR regulator
MSIAGEPTRKGVYGITVAAELVGMGVQTLRLYERRGLLTPSRTQGGTRLYSDEDLVRLRRISTLLDEGLNLAGAAAVMTLERDNAQLRADNAELREGEQRMKEQATPDLAEAAEADALEQLRPAEESEAEVRDLPDVLPAEANEADVIEQSIVVPLDDDHDHEAPE